MLIVVHGQGIFTLSLNGSMLAVPLRLSGDGHAFLQLERFGCLVTRGGARMLMFTGSGRIWVVDTRTWNGTPSEVTCPAASQGKNGLFTWMMSNVDYRPVNGYVRSYVRSLDVVDIIKSFCGTSFVHMFARGGGFHWACGLNPILDGEESNGDGECTSMSISSPPRSPRIAGIEPLSLFRPIGADVIFESRVE